MPLTQIIYPLWDLVFLLENIDKSNFFCKIMLNMLSKTPRSMDDPQYTQISASMEVTFTMLEI